MLLIALAVVLLANVSATIASAASPLSLVDGLRRDLGAVRAQLERVDPAPLEVGRQTVAFNTDIGDGGQAFRHRTMTTILRSARRRLEHLASGYHNAGDEHRAEVAQNAQIELQELARYVDYLGEASDTTSIMWARKRVKAETLLDDLQEMLVILLPGRDDEASGSG